MIAEQTTSTRFWAGEAAAPIRIDLTLRLESPAPEPCVHVAVDLVYDPQLSGSLAEMLQQYVYDGVQAGIAATGLPIPEGGIGVQVSSLQITPRPGSDPPVVPAEHLGKAIEALTAEVTAALWTSVRTFSGTAA